MFAGLGGLRQTALAASPPAGPPAADSFYATRFEKTPKVVEMTVIGRALFSDPSLSASGRLSCASCHVPADGYGPPDGSPVRSGGSALHSPGVRSVPTLTYGQATPPFTEHYSEDDGNDSEDQGPTGGHDWDGRVDSVHEQAVGPLFSPFEMANSDPDAVVAKLLAGPHAQGFRDAFGPHVFEDRKKAFSALLMVLETFQQSPADFYPYSSKYDAMLRHQAVLSAQEARGLALFNDPRKGNCAHCHLSTGRDGAFPQFTDNGLIALGVPRNPAIPANRDRSYFDLGLCGPLRTDFRGRTEYCGLFKTPTLRNVALRRVFFHNGIFRSLEEVLHFYAERDTNPLKYSRGGHGAGAHRFSDLPDAYDANVNVEPPFGGKPGAKPALDEAEIRDIIAFLNTLTDGYATPGAQISR